MTFRTVGHEHDFIAASPYGIAVRALQRRKIDPALARRLRDAGFRRAPAFSWPAAAAAVLGIYRKLLAK